MAEWTREKYSEMAKTLNELRDNEDIELDWETTQALGTAIDIIEEAAPRMADSYWIRHAIHIGDKEVVFGENKTPTEENPAYLVAYAETYYDLGVTQYRDGMAGDDYLEIMRLFLERVEGQMRGIEKERTELGIPDGRFTLEHVVPDSRLGEYAGKLMVVRAEVLRPEYQNMAHQLVLAESGNGCTSRGIGSGVFSTTLATGKHQRFERVDFLGELKPECVPDWAKAALAKLQPKEQAAARGKRKNQEER